jgi:hypothetical protein
MRPCVLSAVLTTAALALLAPAAARARDTTAAAEAPQLYAFYCWSDGYLKFAADAHKVGVHWFRVGHWMGEAEDDRAALAAAKAGDHLVPVLGLGNDAKNDNPPPVDEVVARYRKLCHDMVARYGPRGKFWAEHQDSPALPIRYWEIWNEPNIDFLQPPEGVLRTEMYAKLLQAASEEIRKLDPGATIIAFNTAGGVPDRDKALKPDGMFQRLKYIGWRKFIRDTVTLAGTKCFDGVGTHPYSQPAGPETGGVAEGIDMVREVAKELNFLDKPIWFTEVGWALEYPNNRQVRDARQQACFLARLFAIAAAHGVTQVQVMYIEDIIYSTDNTRRSFGLFTAPGKWREQATAARTMIRLLPDPRRGARVLGEEMTKDADGKDHPGVWAYRFNGANGWPIIMAWNAGDGRVAREFAVASADVTLVDMLGKSGAVQPSGGNVKVDLEEAPVYIVPAAMADVDRLLAD